MLTPSLQRECRVLIFDTKCSVNSHYADSRLNGRHALRTRLQKTVTLRTSGMGLSNISPGTYPDSQVSCSLSQFPIKLLIADRDSAGSDWDFSRGLQLGGYFRYSKRYGMESFVVTYPATHWWGLFRVKKKKTSCVRILFEVLFVNLRCR